MKPIFFCLFFICFFHATTFGQRKKAKGWDAQHWGLFLELGMDLKDYSGLSTAYFGSPEVLEKSVTGASGLSIRMDWERVTFEVATKRGTFSEQTDADALVELKHTCVLLSAGYDLIENEKVRLVPMIGMGKQYSEILLNTKKQGPFIQPAVVGYYSTNTWTSSDRAFTERLYANISLLASIGVDVDKGAALYPLDVGVKLNYAFGLGNNNWKDAFDESIHGPNLFTHNVYAGLIVGWWL